MSEVPQSTSTTSSAEASGTPPPAAGAGLLDTPDGAPAGPQIDTRSAESPDDSMAAGAEGRPPVSLREALFGEERLLEQERLTRRSTWSNWTVLAMLVLCFFVVVQWRPFASRTKVVYLAPSDDNRLDEFRLQHLGGTETVALGDLTGRVSLLVFWEPSEDRSRRQMPGLLDGASPGADSPSVRFYPVVCEQGENESLGRLFNQTQKYLREFGLSMRPYIDPDGVTRDAVRRHVTLSDYPTALCIDRSGRIRGVWRGLDSESVTDIGHQLDKLLAE